MTRTFFLLRVYIEGTGAVNAPHLKRQDGAALATVLIREIATPPVACPGMFIKIRREDGAHEVESMTWAPDDDCLTLTSQAGIHYWDQGPVELTGRARVEAFFDQIVAEYLSNGWRIADRDGMGELLKGKT